MVSASSAPVAREPATSVLKKGDRHLAACDILRCFRMAPEPVPVFQRAATTLKRISCRLPDTTCRTISKSFMPARSDARHAAGGSRDSGRMWFPPPTAGQSVALPPRCHGQFAVCAHDIGRHGQFAVRLTEFGCHGQLAVRVTGNWTSPPRSTGERRRHVPIGVQSARTWEMTA
jgi:hypothetical protein